MKLHLSTLSILSLALPLFAQTDSQPSTQASTPAIVLRSASQDPIMGLGMNFDPNLQPPQLQEGQQYVLTVGSDRKAKIGTTATTKYFAHATVYPKVLMAMFKPMIDAQWGQIQGMGMMGLAQAGIQGKQAAIVMNSIRNFPDQIASIDLRITGNPEDGPKGLSFDLDLRGAQDSWLGKAIAALKPAAQNAPAIPAGKHIMAYRMSMSPAGMQEILKPFLHFGASMAGGKEDREAALKLMQEGMGMMGGTGAAWGNMFGGTFITVFDTDQPGLFSKLMTSETYQAMMDKIYAMNPGMDMEITPKALVHREVEVFKTTMSMPMPNPAAPDGEMVTYQAAAGKHLVSVAGGKADAIKSVIDMALDNKVKTAPMAGGRMMEMNIRIADLLETLVGMNPLDDAPGGSPQLLSVKIDKKQGSLALSISLN